MVSVATPPERLARLPSHLAPDGTRVFVASSPASRLIGLAGLRDLPLDCALLIPRCRSVHTLAMRFALDVDFLDATGEPIRRLRAVPPARLLYERGATAVLERRARER